MNCCIRIFYDELNVILQILTRVKDMNTKKEYINIEIRAQKMQVVSHTVF